MSAAETLHAFGRDYVLHRYPPSKDNALRAWDAADEYLLNTLQEQQIDLSEVCIINDNFGALTLPLAEYKPLCYGDSWLSREALLRNLTLNQCDQETRFVTRIEELTSQPNTARYIIGRIPKSKRQLAYLLQQLNRWVPADCTLLLAGMDKHLSRGQFDLLAQYFGPARFYPGVKKARIWEAKVDKTLSTATIKPNQLSIDAFTLSLSSRPNVFSQDKLDIGSRFFLDNFKLLPERTKVADLACGNGILGLCYLRLHPQSELSFVDESFQAVQSVQDNILANMPAAKTQVHSGDGLTGFADRQFELILCNPPFHLQHTVSTEIARSLFKDAWRCLQAHGEFWVVANRHLGYHTVLKSIFGQVKVRAANQKFVILAASRA
jgi:16S rRNA G1207 methylase RsmC